MVVYTFIKNNSIPVVSIQMNASGGGAGVTTKDTGQVTSSATRKINTHRSLNTDQINSNHSGEDGWILDR